MTRLLHILPFVIALVLCAASAYVAFKMGKRWRQGYADAKNYRADLEQKAAQLAQFESRQVQVVNANPQIYVGSRVQSELHNERRGTFTGPYRGALCPLCNRNDCWLDCGEEIDGRRDGVLPEHLGHRRDPASPMVADAVRALARRESFSEYRPLCSEEDLMQTLIGEGPDDYYIEDDPEL